MNRLALRIAGQAVAVDWPSADWLPPVLPRLGKFQVDPGDLGPPDLHVRVAVSPDVAAAPGGEPRVEEDDNGLHLRHDQFHGQIWPDGQATLTIYQAEAGPVDLTYAMVIDSLLRMGLAAVLVPAGGVMLHAAGIAVSPTQGFVFFGPSGSGKTTVCGLSSPPYDVLCDEVVAIFPTPSGYRLAGTPFAGAWGDSIARDVPLVEVFHLRQATATARLPLSTGEAVRAVLESAVAYHRSPAMREGVLAAIHALVLGVPVSQLAFVAKETLWETVLAPY